MQVVSVKPRLVIAILATLVEEIAAVAVVLWVLPSLGVNIPTGGLIGIMAGLVTWAVFSYRFGSRALMKKPVAGLSDMIGLQGEVVKPLAPEGVIRIGSELWRAKTTDRKINVGKRITVVEQDGLKLIVRRLTPEDSSGT